MQRAWLIFVIVLILQTILVQSNNQKHMIELPSFVCRGLITHIHDAVYNCLFVDHGISFELSQDQFCIIPHDFISDKYLTETVGVCNVLPVCMRKNTLNGHESTKV